MSDLMQADSYYPVFQPLVQLMTGHVFGYEALLRSITNQSPETLFRAARAADCLNDLDILSIKKAISAYFTETTFTSSAPLLFINVFPSTLLHPAFDEFLHEGLSHYPPLDKRIVLEINEANEEDKMWEIRLLGQKIRGLRQSGFLIALDDVGSGAASLKKIIEYEPDIVKLDRYFGHHLSASRNKQKLISLFINYCAGQTQLVLEGIEEPEDLETAKTLGVPVGQGFLLGRPDSLKLS
ncbi:EAL domain-containing protein [Paenibacillus eucommiae]|uniref:EAL domain-containing protein (Putative c-di-GMP-specific phosphodiesterase class I) n=1 Tax=Paenibacillus eucommiae TaxID=1355755 RepID=A0ABS4IRI6_9BACL|nr:EAL domain-containing protein [Paenibacillus eucommiae]MBP1990186.1 EAL domain-containing protein (putative c-di-GMP-specific phosphodiesterase class I) [Paenibacillus eucommiae]